MSRDEAEFRALKRGSERRVTARLAESLLAQERAALRREGAARTLQRFARGRHNRMAGVVLRYLHDATARRIQCVCRGGVARCRVRRLRAIREGGPDNAASHIQAQQRGVSSRQLLAGRHAAATRIGAAARGHAVRRGVFCARR